VRAAPGFRSRPGVSGPVAGHPDQGQAGHQKGRAGRQQGVVGAGERQLAVVAACPAAAGAASTGGAVVEVLARLAVVVGVEVVDVVGRAAPGSWPSRLMFSRMSLRSLPVRVTVIWPPIRAPITGRIMVCKFSLMVSSGGLGRQWSGARGLRVWLGPVRR
jgi:hypothetical protein